MPINGDILLLWETQRSRISPVDISGTDELSCSLDNTLGVGAEQFPGVTVEGVGVVVPGVINERSQASKKVMTQHLDGTKGLEKGSELGSVAAEVEDAKAIRRKGK